VLLDEAALVGDGALRRWHEGEHEREGGRERGKVGTRSKKNLRRGEGRVEGRGGGRERERAGGCRRTNAKPCLHLRGVAPGVGARQEMEEIRGNTAELDKPAEFVLSGVRNANRRHRVVGGRRLARRPIACPAELPFGAFVRSPSRPIGRPLYAEIGNLLSRDSRSRR